MQVWQHSRLNEGERTSAFAGLLYRDLRSVYRLGMPFCRKRRTYMSAAAAKASPVCRRTFHILLKPTQHMHTMLLVQNPLPQKVSSIYGAEPHAAVRTQVRLHFVASVSVISGTHSSHLEVEGDAGGGIAAGVVRLQLLVQLSHAALLLVR